MAGSEVDDNHHPGIRTAVATKQHNDDIGKQQQRARPQARRQGLAQVTDSQCRCRMDIPEIQP